MPVSVTCVVCGKVELVAPSRAKSYRTCSHACYSFVKAGGEPRQQRVCRQCGKIETVRRSRAVRPYCSAACRNVAYKLPPELLKPRDKEARRVSHRRSVAKRVFKKKGFGNDPGDLTTEQWKVILAAFGGRCAYCGVLAERLTMDHIVPVTKGGRHTALNVVPSCMWCNQSKRDREVLPKFYPSDWPAIESTLRG